MVFSKKKEGKILIKGIITHSLTYLPAGRQGSDAMKTLKFSRRSSFVKIKNKMNWQSGRSGFIKLIIVLVIALIVLGYFGFNIQQIMQSPTVGGNLSYAWHLVVELWNNVLVVPATFVWDKIIVGMLWNNFVALIDKVQLTTPSGQ